MVHRANASQCSSPAAMPEATSPVVPIRPEVMDMISAPHIRPKPLRTLSLARVPVIDVQT